MTNKDFFIQTWQSEMEKTLTAVNGLPSDMEKLNYRCDAKARSAAEIIGHMLQHAASICNATQSFRAEEESHNLFASVDEATTYFLKYAKLLVERLNETDEAIWNEQIVEFYEDGAKIFQYPMSAVFWVMMFDIIHHRGQLSTYYRHMGVRNPDIYGPTAEDMEAMMAAKN